MTQTPQVEQKADIFSKAIILKLSISLPGNHRKVSTSQIEVEADKSMLNVNKELLDCPEFDAINTRINKMKSIVDQVALLSPLGAGHRLIPMSEVVRLDNEIVACIEECETELIPAMMAVYEQRCEESFVRLKALGNRADYPTAQRFRASFGIFHSYMTYGTPTTLEQISPELFARETEKGRQRVEAATDAIVDALFANFGKLTADLVERIQAKDSGEKGKKFKGLLDNFGEYFDALKVQIPVIAGTSRVEELEKLAAQARDILDGVDSKTLDSSKMREYVRDSFKEVQKQIDTLSVAAPIRRARFIDVSAATADAA